MATYEATRYTGIVDAGLIVGTSVFTNSSNLPTSSIEVGAVAYVSDTNKLYMWNGTAWFNIAIVNQAPTAITGNQATYVLAKDGTPTVVTLVSTDPEGLPLTFSSSTSGDTQVGVVTNTDNVFTITPSTNVADMGTLSVTFSVTDGNNTETSVSSFTLVFLSPYWNETVLSIGTSSTNGLNNSTFIDRSTNAHTVTPTGTPVQTAFHPYLDNWSVEFDGSGDYLTLTAGALGSGDFTVEAWIKYTEYQTNNTLYDNRVSAGSSTGFYFGSSNSNKIGVFTANANRIEHQTTIELNIWYHIALVRSSNVWKIYVNGVESTGSYTSSANISDTNLGIGTARTFLAGDVDFHGYISNLRAVAGTALYTTNFTPPTEKLTAVTGTSLLTCQSNRFVDNSSNAHAITPAGNVSVSAFNPFGQESEYAVGENRGSAYLFQNTLDVPSSSALNLSSSDFTISCWVYLTSYPGTYSGNGAGNNALLLAKDTLNAREYTIGITGTSTSYTSISMTLFTSSTLAVGINANYNFKLHNWYYISVVRNGVSTRIYVDGVDIGGGSSVNPQSTSTALTIGAEGAYWRGVGYEYWFRGYISDLKFVKGTALYTTNFTPPTAPVGNTNASLYLPFDNAGIFDKTGNNTLTPVGNASTSTTQTKYADTAMYFDGSGDYFTTTEIVLDSNYTVEAWTRLSTNNTSYPFIFSFGTFYLRFGDSGYGFKLQAATLDSGASSIYSCPITQTDIFEQWAHIALTRENGVNRIFFNGVQQNLNTGANPTTYPLTSWTDTSIVSASSPLVGYQWNGYIENLQILKGVAKYTANFTPPNRTQGRTYQEES